MFRLDNSKFPTTDQGLQSLGCPQPLSIPPSATGAVGGYLRRISSKDPWGAEYQYAGSRYPRQEYRPLRTRLRTLSPAVTAWNADIGNWNIGDE